MKRTTKLSFDELLEQGAAKDFLYRAERDMLPKMKASAMSLVIGADTPDIKLCLEVGAAILFDKPLLIIVPPGRTISKGLQRVASAVVELDVEAPDAMEKFGVAFKEMMELVEKGKTLT